MGAVYDFMMTEHPGWRRSSNGIMRVFTLPSGRHCLSKVGEDGARSRIRMLDPDVFRLPEAAATEIPELREALDSLGRVGRIRNPNLWEAIATAILRQVIRASQSKKLYALLCETHGATVARREEDGSVYYAFPEPQIILQLSDSSFAELGLAFKMAPLRAAASHYLTSGARWRSLSPSRLVEELQTIPRVGAWTARAAVADWSNDWSLYPYGDLAIRKWASRAAPGHSWASDEPTFAEQWRSLCGEHISSLTLLVLAWGSQRGDIG